MEISEEEYMNMLDSYQGFCTNCEEFTRDCTEPDAEGYDCPECDKLTVMGIEQALFSGKLGVK